VTDAQLPGTSVAVAVAAADAEFGTPASSHGQRDRACVSGRAAAAAASVQIGATHLQAHIAAVSPPAVSWQSLEPSHWHGEWHRLRPCNATIAGAPSEKFSRQDLEWRLTRHFNGVTRAVDLDNQTTNPWPNPDHRLDSNTEVL
jgi:hypothetical protein